MEIEKEYKALNDTNYDNNYDEIFEINNLSKY